MLFSVFTYCYNSSATLRRTYESLIAQTDYDFEWILVDDCSTDDGATSTLIRQLAADAPFQVKSYFLEQNYFGARSLSTACMLAEGQYACILDHDDMLKKDAMETVRSYIAKYRDRVDVAGVSGRCIDQAGSLIGKKFQADEQVVNEGVIRFRQKITSELCQFTKVDILQRWSGLMRAGYTGGFIWAKISREYKYVFINDVLRVYDTALPTSYSNSKSFSQRYPDARAEALFEILQDYSGYLIFNPFFSLKLSASMIRHRVNAKLSILPTDSFSFMVGVFLYLSVPIGILKSKEWI